MAERRGARLVVASGNRHKVGELRRLLAGCPEVAAIEVVPAISFGVLPEIAEDRPTFAGNAARKAVGFAGWLHRLGEPGDTLVLADDSGLCVDALGGRPGVFSARFAGEAATDADNNQALVRALEAAGVTASPAHYVCALALARVDGRPLPEGDAEGLRIFHGRWDGEARITARGDGGFGYDPLVWLDGGARTVAELTAADKGARSHRGRALGHLVRALPAILTAIRTVIETP